MSHNVLPTKPTAALSSAQSPVLATAGSMIKALSRSHPGSTPAAPYLLSPKGEQRQLGRVGPVKQYCRSTTCISSKRF